MANQHTVAGIMSGTSLDGLDIALCRFDESDGRWTFDILAAQTIPYAADWRNLLSGAYYGSAASMAKLHSYYGKYIGEQVKLFVDEIGIGPSLVSSHGHTVFHQADKGYTFQLGCGSAIAAVTGIDTVCDFRSTDISLGGQGAPLVPVGDRYLFAGHKFCLNLGGFANISFEKDNQRLASDICPVNIALNHLAAKLGLSYDDGGEVAMHGNVIPELLQQLNELEFYQLPSPKSLGREWFEKEFLPLIENDQQSIEDRLRTVVEHAGMQIANALFLAPGTTLFTTGGGAFNNLLVEVIEENISRHGIHVVVPDAMIVQFKEAVVFAFLGLLRNLNQINVLSSVTGASTNSVSGALYKGVAL